MTCWKPHVKIGQQFIGLQISIFNDWLSTRNDFHVLRNKLDLLKSYIINSNVTLFSYENVYPLLIFIMFPVTIRSLCQMMFSFF